MRIFGLDIQRSAPIPLALPAPAVHNAVMGALTEEKQNQFEDVLQRLVAASNGTLADVTPENCMQSPTVHAIVTAVSRRLSVTPVGIYKTGKKNGRDTKEKQPGHSVAKLLNYPNNFQTRVNYWGDAASWLLRYGRYYAYKSQGSTGPIRALLPMQPRCVTPKMNYNTWTLSYEWTPQEGQFFQVYPASKVHHVRSIARDGYTGDSPISDVRRSIALEIAAEQFGATFFQNGALPLMILKYVTGNKGFKTAEDEKKFVEDFQDKFSGDKRHRALLLPAGMETGNPIAVENDKAQMIESRRYQRTVIAGAFGVPPHLVGDLERATFNNVEQQDSDFTLNVVMPIVQQFEAAMELDLLTTEDTNNGLVVRFNLDSILRADFKSRQEGLQIQRQNGVICADEWRETESKNPMEDEAGGELYLRPANFVPLDTPAPTEPVATPPADQGNQRP